MEASEIFWGESCTKLASYPLQLIFSWINQPYLQQNSWSLCRSWYYAHRSQILCQFSKHWEKQKYSGFKADTAASYYLLALPTMLTKSSVCVNPILYFGFNPQVFSISFSIFPSCSWQLKNLTQIYMASSKFCAGNILTNYFPWCVGLSALLAFLHSLAQMSRWGVRISLANLASPAKSPSLRWKDIFSRVLFKYTDASMRSQAELDFLWVQLL